MDLQDEKNREMTELESKRKNQQINIIEIEPINHLLNHMSTIEKNDLADK